MKNITLNISNDDSVAWRWRNYEATKQKLAFMEQQLMDDDPTFQGVVQTARRYEYLRRSDIGVTVMFPTGKPHVAVLANETELDQLVDEAIEHEQQNEFNEGEPDKNNGL